MIPKRIHFCWFGAAEYSETIKKCLHSWEQRLPDYQIVRWDETNTPFDQLPFLKVLYQQKRWAFIADYIRLYAVFKYGGIYLDTDVEVIRRFDDLLQHNAFIGFQTDMQSSKFPINSAVLGGEKGNRFVERCLQETERLQRTKYHPMGGPIVSSNVLLNEYGITEYKDQQLADVTVLTRDYFYPFSWLESYSDSCITPHTYAIHWWEDSWSNKKKNLPYFWRSFMRKLQRTPLIFQSRTQYVFNKRDFYLYQKV